MQRNCLGPTQVEVIASVLRKHADANLDEYIRSAQGHGALSFETLTARLETLVEVALKARELAPAFADRFREFDLDRYLKIARTAAMNVPANRSN